MRCCRELTCICAWAIRADPYAFELDASFHLESEGESSDSRAARHKEKKKKPREKEKRKPPKKEVRSAHVRGLQDDVNRAVQALLLTCCSCRQSP